MDSAELTAGKARVDTYLIDPLTEKGMVRPRGQTLAKFEEALKGLRSRLSYLTSGELSALAEAVERLATGKARDTWPSQIIICGQARSMRPPPPSDSALVCRTMQCHHGKNAVAGGYHVALYSWVKKHGRFPNDFVVSEVMKKGITHQEWLGRIGKMQYVTGQDAEFLKWYRAQDARIQAIVAPKASEASA